MSGKPADRLAAWERYGKRCSMNASLRDSVLLQSAPMGATAEELAAWRQKHAEDCKKAFAEWSERHDISWAQYVQEAG